MLCFLSMLAQRWPAVTLTILEAGPQKGDTKSKAKDGSLISPLLQEQSVKICNNLVNVTHKYNTSILCSVEIGLVC